MASATYRALVAQRKLNGECIDCGRPSEEFVRCTGCRGKIAASRQEAIANGRCSICRLKPRRLGRTTCAPCALKAGQIHKKVVQRKRERACNATCSVVDSVGVAARDDSAGHPACG